MTAPEAAPTYHERLTPGPWMFVTLLIMVPAVMLVMTPLNQDLAIPVAVVLYITIAASLLLAAPTVSVHDGVLTAGTARIPVEQLGAIDLLSGEELREAIGPKLDARAYLMVRGYIHSGIRVVVADATDPAPYWVITSRKPQTLRAAIVAAQAATAA